MILYREALKILLHKTKTLIINFYNLCSSTFIQKKLFSLTGRNIYKYKGNTFVEKIKDLNDLLSPGSTNFSSNFRKVDAAVNWKLSRNLDWTTFFVGNNFYRLVLLS